MLMVMLSICRYHEDEPQKFGHLTPGLPSSKLREALGLRTEELPRYLYRMRELGYRSRSCHTN